MFERLQRLYSGGEITKKGLEAAVRRKWITEEEMREIIEDGTEG